MMEVLSLAFHKQLQLKTVLNLRPKITLVHLAKFNRFCLKNNKILIKYNYSNKSQFVVFNLKRNLLSISNVTPFIFLEALHN